MATDKKTSEETTSGAITDVDYVRGVQGGVNVKMLFSAIKTWVQSISFSFTSIDIGNADTTISRDSAGVIAVEGKPLYAGIPQNSKSAAYTTVLADRYKHILHPAADNNPRTFTIDSNANVPYAIGDTITFVNEINIVTIAINGTDTLALAGSALTGSRTLAANGVATALKVTSTKWYISGAGVT